MLGIRWGFIKFHYPPFSIFFPLKIEKGLSQEELALKSGLNRPYISAIEKGKRNVSLEVMEKLAGAMNIKIPDFFTE